MRFFSLTAVLCLTLSLFSPNELFAQDRQIRSKGILAKTGWTPNQNPTHYFLSPSAFNLEKGEVDYTNVYIDLSFINYGVTNWFSVGGGAELVGTLISLVRRDLAPLYSFTPKVGFAIGKNWHVGAGFMGGIYGGRYEGSLSKGSAVKGAGMAYGNATYGNPDYNITLGAGIPFWTGAEELISPVLMLNGICRIRKDLYLISETWVMTSQESYLGPMELLGYGIRWNVDNMSLDVGFYNNRFFAEYLFIGLPFFNIVYRFKKR